MSAGETKCQVGRRMWVRRISPAANAASTPASVQRTDRIPSAHFAIAYSCDWTASRPATASAGVANGSPSSRWVRGAGGRSRGR